MNPDDTGTPAAPVGYGVTLAVCLPRDAISVPIIRHLVRYALDEVGVLEEISNDIELALTEACANVMDHAGPGDRYEVTVTVQAERCELRVVDLGHGFDHRTLASAPQDDSQLKAERGRGLGLMHALVDHIELVSEPEAGTLVRLVKRLAFNEHAPARRLLFQALHAATGDPAGAAPYPADRTHRAAIPKTASATDPT